MTIRLLTGDCRETLVGVASGSVQCVITSPPYYGLRSYGTEDLIWGGDASFEHEHVWESLGMRTGGGSGQNRTLKGDLAESRTAIDSQQTTAQGTTCVCGAWRGSLGLEPTLDLYVEHLVEVFRLVRRVLREDGTVWLNLGDSYSGSGKGGTKSKDLLMIPFRVAIALQTDGWYLRSVIPWVKRSAMPESVTDRPSTAIEYVFLLAKSDRYFWDAEAIHQGEAISTRKAGGYQAEGQMRVEHGRVTRPTNAGGVRDRDTTTVGRNRRNSDWFFESLASSETGETWQQSMLDDERHPPDANPDDLAMEKRPQSPRALTFARETKEQVIPGQQVTQHRTNRPAGGPFTGNDHALRERRDGHARPPDDQGRSRRNSDWFMESWQGLMLDETDQPLALVVNPMPLKEAHFASFPPKLVEPMLKASTSERGHCPQCGAPWRRVVQRTIGWQASCGHGDLEPMAQTVLDCFGGAGTVGLVAERLGRNAIVCDLNTAYVEMSHTRLEDTLGPMFLEVQRGMDDDDATHDGAASAATSRDDDSNPF